ncbi:MAG: dihydroorotate dehydrogenase electron transfer subunit [Muribaculaceae bacterium]|nr:dihydroorotate dehydrogenase electron transfer subunit [Muribaculaceae bacterium]
MKDIRKKLIIEENRQLSSRTWQLKLRGDIDVFTSSGQFVNIAVPGKYLRRPISVSQYFTKEKYLILLYNIAGEGTKILSELKPGEPLDVLVGLGNGFSIPKDIRNPLLLGGGIGAAPLMQLAVDLLACGKKPKVVIGYNTAVESWGMEKELRNLGIETYIATMDGSEGTKGFVTDVIREKDLQYDYFYACGPMPMLKALRDLPTEGEMSLECRMGCGYGVCMCCSLETKSGSKRICKEGPVFLKSELIWK